MRIAILSLLALVTVVMVGASIWEIEYGFDGAAPRATNARPASSGTTTPVLALDASAAAATATPPNDDASAIRGLAAMNAQQRRRADAPNRAIRAELDALATQIATAGAGERARLVGRFTTLAARLPRIDRMEQLARLPQLQTSGDDR